ncbi:MAG: hypothetical protein KKD97_16030 [Gammaproteobacteria bacterium]|nr:hypothetical protein [Gammaproteobacteria bacterium]
MLATQERQRPASIVQALRTHAQIVSTAGVQLKPATRADFIEEVRTDMVKAMRQEIQFVNGLCLRPDMSPTVTLINRIHAVQQMLDCDLSTQVVLLIALRESKCQHVRALAQALPLLGGSLREMTTYVQEKVESDKAVSALLMDALALSECHHVQQLRDVISSGYAYMVGPSVAACRGASA